MAGHYAERPGGGYALAIRRQGQREDIDDPAGRVFGSHIVDAVEVGPAATLQVRDAKTRKLGGQIRQLAVLVGDRVVPVDVGFVTVVDELVIGVHRQRIDVLVGIGRRRDQGLAPRCSQRDGVESSLRAATIDGGPHRRARAEGVSGQRGLVEGQVGNADGLVRRIGLRIIGGKIADGDRVHGQRGRDFAEVHVDVAGKISVPVEGIATVALPAVHVRFGVDHDRGAAKTDRGRAGETQGVGTVAVADLDAVVPLGSGRRVFLVDGHDAESQTRHRLAETERHFDAVAARGHARPIICGAVETHFEQPGVAADGSGLIGDVAGLRRIGVRHAAGCQRPGPVDRGRHLAGGIRKGRAGRDRTFVGKPLVLPNDRADLRLRSRCAKQDNRRKPQCRQPSVAETCSYRAGATCIRGSNPCMTFRS